MEVMPQPHKDGQRDPASLPQLSNDGQRDPASLPQLSNDGQRDPSSLPQLSNDGQRDPSSLPQLSNDGQRDPSSLPQLSNDGQRDPSSLPQPHKDGQRDPSSLPQLSNDGQRDPSSLPQPHKDGQRDPSSLPQLSNDGQRDPSSLPQLSNDGQKDPASTPSLGVPGPQGSVLVGKTLVAIGAGNPGKLQLYIDAPHLGVKVVLVDSDPDHPARHLVDTFLPLDISDHTQDAQHAHTIVRALRAGEWERGVAGCLTLVEDCVPLAAYVAQALGLPQAMSVEAALNAKSKHRTLAVLGQQGRQSSPQSAPAVYASPVVRVHTVQQVADALNKVTLPAVMKLEFGCNGVGVKHVHSVQEAEEHMQLVQKTMHSEAVVPGVGINHGQSMVLMPRLVGSQHNVDVVLFEGQLVGGFVSDQGSTHLPFCLEAAVLMPSLLPKEQQHTLIRAAASCCVGLGLRTGVYCSEFMLTSAGPRLIEVNGRMSSAYVRDWTRRVHGLDLLLPTLLCAFGIRPLLPQSCSLEQNQDCNGDRTHHTGCGKEYILGILLYYHRHDKALTTTATPRHLRRLHEEGRLIFAQYQQEVDSTTSVFERPFASLGVSAASPREARRKLIKICTDLGLETEQSLLKVLPRCVKPS